MRRPPSESILGLQVGVAWRAGPPRAGSRCLRGAAVPETIFDIDWDCHFDFTIPDVPFSECYSIETGRRGKVAYSFDDLETRDWEIELTLGDD